MPFFEAEKVDPLSIPEVSKKVASELKSLVPSLLSGLEKTELDAKVAEALSVPVDDQRVVVARMNLIGGLRVAGYEVTGGRSGGTKYQIVGEKAPAPPKKTIDEAPEPIRKLWSEFVQKTHTLEDIVEDVSTVDAEFAKRSASELLHTANWMYLWAYLGAQKNALHLMNFRDCTCVVQQKHKSRPRLAVHYLSGSPKDALSLAVRLAKISVSGMSVTGMSRDTLPAWVDALSAMELKASTSMRKTAVYDLTDFADNPRKYLGKRGASQLRARVRDTTLDSSPSVAAQLAVIETWRKANEAKHRQLAIKRDFAAVESCADKIVIGGMRDGYPVAHHLVYRLPNRSDAVMLANEKSLNYTETPGGKPGVSDWNQFMLATRCKELGIRWMNSGGIDGGGAGLSAKKEKYAHEIIEEPTLHLKLERADY